MTDDLARAELIQWFKNKDEVIDASSDDGV